MARRRAYKPIAKDLRRRRRWLSLDPKYACYPDTARPMLKFRPDFPPDYTIPTDLRQAQAQDEHNPDSMLETENYQLIPPTHQESCPQHKPSPQHYQDPDGPKPPRESRYPSIRHKDRFPSSRIEPTSRSYAQAAARTHSDPSRRAKNSRSPSTASVAMPRTHADDRELRDPDRARPNNRADVLQAQLRKERAEWERQYQIVVEDGYEYKRRIEHLNSELTQRDVQIRALKHTISKVRTGNASMATDSQISGDYQYLISQLKNWTLSHFRGCSPTHTIKTIADFGLDNESHPGTVAAVNKHLTDNSTRKFLAIGMLVMWYLDDHIFDRFLFGMDDKEEKYWSNLAESFGKTSTQREVNFWRSSTIKMIMATELHQRKIKDRKKELVVQLESILVNTVPATGNATKRMENLKIVVDQAVNLALTLRVQRARYFLYNPQPGKKFQDHFMEPAEDDMDDDSDGEASGEEGGGKFMGIPFLKVKSQKKVVGLSVYPALIKSGNEDGEKYDENVCVCKAKALKA